MIRLRMRGREADVLVHVEGDDVLEGDFAILVLLDKVLVDDFWTASCWETEDEGFLGCGVIGLDTGCLRLYSAWIHVQW